MKAPGTHPDVQPILTLLDVGHGVCAVLRDRVGTVMFDVPPGGVPFEFLRSKRIKSLDAVFLSHFHKNHAAGATALFPDTCVVGTAFINPPRSNRIAERLFQRVMMVMQEANRERGTRIVNFVQESLEPVLARGEVQIEIVAPQSIEVMTLKELRPGGRVRTEHSCCGVVRVSYDGRPRVLLTGDLDERGLDAIVQRGASSLVADVLVYPHHGGTSDNRDQRAFAARLASLVTPQLVVFSLARDAAERPAPDVVAGLRSGSDAPYLICTQLSRGCHMGAVRASRHHTSPVSPHPCGGSIDIDLHDTQQLFRTETEHDYFVQHGVERPRCRAAALA